MMVTTAIIAIPTGIKIFSWLATLWRGVLRLDTPMLFALGFLTMFTLGGISGVMLAMIPLTIHVSDTYFIVAHIHYVLFGGSLFTIFAGVYYWFPKMTGRMYDETLGKLHFWMTFIFFNLTFGPMHLIGVEGMPRRVYDYAEEFADYNLFISVASFILGLSTLIFAYNIVVELARRPARVGEPVARAHARVAGLLAAADLQLRLTSRPSSAARTSTASRARSTACSRAARGSSNPRAPPPSQRGSRSACPRSSSSPTARSPAASCSRRCASATRTAGSQFHLVVPMSAPAARQRDLRRRRARRRAAAHRPRHRLPGASWASSSPARSATRTRTPATLDALATFPADEIIVSTLPQTRSGWLRRDLIERIARRDRQARSQHVVTDPAQEGLAVGVTLVVANRTAGGDELIEPAQGRRAGRTASSSPSSRRRAATARPRTIARQRLTEFLARLRENGIIASGMIGDPDPYDAIMNALDLFTVDHVVISTLPRHEVRLAARRPRRRACATRPRRKVDHVEVALEGAPAELDGSVRQRRPPRPPRAARRPTAARAWSPSCSGCCSSSSPRSWSSGPSSRPTSSSGSCRESSGSRSRSSHLPKAVAGVNTAILLSSSLTMHWALESIKRGNRNGAEGRPAADDAARRDVPLHPDQRVRRADRRGHHPAGVRRRARSSTA